jgi:hypothetical protein
VSECAVGKIETFVSFMQVETAARLLRGSAMNYAADADPSAVLSKHPPKLSQEKSIGRVPSPFWVARSGIRIVKVASRGNRDESQTDNS